MSALARVNQLNQGATSDSVELPVGTGRAPSNQVASAATGKILGQRRKLITGICDGSRAL